MISDLMIAAIPLAFDPEDRDGQHDAALREAHALAETVVQDVEDAILAAHRGGKKDEPLLRLYPVLRMVSRICEAHFRIRNRVQQCEVGLYTGDSLYEVFKVRVSSRVEALERLAERVICPRWWVAVDSLERSVLRHLLEELGLYAQARRLGDLHLEMDPDEFHLANCYKAANRLGGSAPSGRASLYPRLLKWAGRGSDAAICSRRIREILAGKALE